MKLKDKACALKRHLTETAAYTYARKTWGEKQLRVYKCQYCSMFHVSRHKRKRMEYLFSLVESQLGIQPRN